MGNTHIPEKGVGIAFFKNYPYKTLKGTEFWLMPHLGRARVMLVAAKILAHGGKPKSAISCTRDVRDLAARHSALQYGSSGVASAVTHEAFKLEVGDLGG